MLASLIRTFVPWLVAVVGPAAARWFGWTDAELTTAATLLVGGVYYLLARLAERYLSPRFGWLLGLAQAPTYTARHAAGGSAGAEDAFRRAVDESRRYGDGRL